MKYLKAQKKLKMKQTVEITLSLKARAKYTYLIHSNINNVHVRLYLCKA